MVLFVVNLFYCPYLDPYFSSTVVECPMHVDCFFFFNNVHSLQICSVLLALGFTFVMTSEIVILAALERSAFFLAEYVHTYFDVMAAICYCLILSRWTRWQASFPPCRDLHAA